LKKKLLLLDLVLLAAVAVVAIQARDKWREASKREQVMLGRKLKPSPPPPYAALAAVAPLSAAAYVDIVEKNLFSTDRNPTVIVEVAPPPKMPELPVFFGAMNLGDGPVAMMSVKSGETQQQIRYGEKIGEFVLVAVNRDQIILEWDGKQITKSPSDLSPKEPASNRTAAAAAAAPAARAAEPQPQATSVNVASAPAQAAPGKDTGGGVHACVAGDTSPAGTVRDGARKVTIATPFGTMCRWEPVK
jgi:hypothetical protein